MQRSLKDHAVGREHTGKLPRTSERRDGDPVRLIGNIQTEFVDLLVGHADVGELIAPLCVSEAMLPNMTWI